MKRLLRQSRTSAAPGRAPALLALAAAVALACYPGPGVPPRVDPAPASFERLPYLQAVTADSAVVRWRVDGDPGTDLAWRHGGTEGWREASVETRGEGDRRAALGGLGPSAAVAYRVRAGGTEAGPYRFRTAPPDSSSDPQRVLAFGDSGWGSEAQVALSRRMLEVHEEEGWDLAVHVGDVAYPDGTEEDFTVRHFRVYAPLLARVPFQPVPGNHDVIAGGGTAYDRAFESPGGTGGRWWRLRRGRALFLGLDTSSPGARGSLAARRGPQWRWLRSALAEASRDTTVAWTVLVTHYPLYSRAAGISGHGSSEELREALEPLLLRHGVDVVLAGHDHHYERSRPVSEGLSRDPGCAPVHFVVGGGGAARFARSVAPGGHAARVSRSHHYLRLELRPGGATGVAVDPAGREIDRFRIAPYEPGRPSCE